MFDPQIGRFSGVDPIADQFAFVSPFNYAENSPIANIDLWGLQAEGESVENGSRATGAVQENVASTLLNAAVKGGDEVISGLNNASNLKTSIKQIDFVLSATSLISEEQKIKNSAEEQHISDVKITAMIFGEAVAQINPVLGFSVGTILLDSADPDGLTNMKNDKLSKDYSASFDQRKQHPHYQRVLQEQRRKEIAGQIEKISNTPPAYRSIPFISILVGPNQERTKFYRGNPVYYDVLESKVANPTMEVGVEIRKIKY